MAIDIGKIPANRFVQKESKTTSILNRDIRLFGSGMNDWKKERFYNELYVLLMAGIDIRTSLELLVNEAEKKDEKELYSSILNSVVSGSTFPDAIDKTGKFSPYEFYSLRIGEESGRMQIVLKDLSEYFAKKIKQKRKVKSALSYPIVVMTVAVGAVWFMLRFVVPMFADMLKRFHTELPAITQFIIDLSDRVAANGPWILLLLISFIVLAWTQRKTLAFRRVSSSIVLKLPYFSAITTKVYLERFSHSMHLLLASRTPLVNALELVEKMVGFYPIENSIATIRKDIMQGKPLHESMAKFPIYKKRMISLIRVAEEVNQLDIMFEKLSKQYSEEIEHETTVLGSVIEPLMIIFLGVMVSVILIALYLPMFRMSSAFGN